MIGRALRKGLNSVLEREFIQTPDGFNLFCKTWLPAPPPRSVVVLVHGLAEHVMRYAHVAQHLNTHGHAVFGLDLRGHGQSDGKRIYVNRFSAYVDDLALFFAEVASRYPERPIFILAHSMGTTVALNFLLDHAPSVSGLIVTGTALVAGDDISPLLISLSGLVGAIFPKLPTVALNSNSISRDPAVVEAYHKDPLVYNGRIPARTGAALNHAFGYIRSRLRSLTLPILIMHGSEDQLTNPQGSRLLYAGIASKDKTLKIWRGLYHEVLNEPEKDEVLATITTWINERL